MMERGSSKSCHMSQSCRRNVVGMVVGGIAVTMIVARIVNANRASKFCRSMDWIKQSCKFCKW